MHHIIESPAAGDTVALAVGDVIEIRLPQRASTGYRWTVDSAPAILATIPPDTSPNAPSDRPLPGQSTVSAHRFTATDAGTGTLRLALRRPWETVDEDTITLSVTVRDPHT